MIFLGFIWLILTIIDLTKGLSDFLQTINYFIWFLFILDFLLEFILAPKKVIYLKRNWLTIISLLVPAMRVLRAFRIFRMARFFRSTNLIRIMGSFNRGMAALSKTLGRRRFGYIILLTILVVLLGAAGIYSMDEERKVISDFGSAVWWSAMMITTMGSDYFPISSEGRFLSFILAVYGFAIFGYVTATVASFFVDQDKTQKSSTDLKLESLEKEIVELKELIRNKSTS